MRVRRILLVEDHELFRRGLASLIEAQDDMTVVGQAGDGLEALQLARDLQPDLVLMDINMPISDGVEATALIRKRLPETFIMMLTIRDEEAALFDAVKAGANGYMLKDANSDDFLKGVRAVLDGEAVLPPRLASRLLTEFAQLAKRAPPEEPAKPDYGLTSREQEVLELIAKGLTDQEIATRLFLSIHTIKTHVRNILRKLQAANRHEAARLAGDAGIPDS